MTERQKSDKHEKRIAKELQGKRTKGSGSTPYQKEDVRLQWALIQAKRTDKKNITIERKTLERLEKNAMNIGKIPALCIGFGNEQETYDWIAFPLWLVREQILGRP